VLVEPADVPPAVRHKTMQYDCIANSDKPFMGSATGEEHAREGLAMAARLFGGEQAIRERPVMITLSEARALVKAVKERVSEDP